MHRVRGPLLMYEAAHLRTGPPAALRHRAGQADGRDQRGQRAAVPVREAGRLGGREAFPDRGGQVRGRRRVAVVRQQAEEAVGLPAQRPRGRPGGPGTAPRRAGRSAGSTASRSTPPAKLPLSGAGRLPRTCARSGSWGVSGLITRIRPSCSVIRPWSSSSARTAPAIPYSRKRLRQYGLPRCGSSASSSSSSGSVSPGRSAVMAPGRFGPSLRRDPPACRAGPAPRPSASPRRRPPGTSACRPGGPAGRGRSR